MKTIIAGSRNVTDPRHRRAMRMMINGTTHRVKLKQAKEYYFWLGFLVGCVAGAITAMAYAVGNTI